MTLNCQVFPDRLTKTHKEAEGVASSQHLALECAALYYATEKKDNSHRQPLIVRARIDAITTTALICAKTRRKNVLMHGGMNARKTTRQEKRKAIEATAKVRNREEPGHLETLRASTNVVALKRFRVPIRILF